MQDMTFFLWADTHCGYALPPRPLDWHNTIIEQMKSLPGRPYPTWIGGTVADPLAVLHAGDLIDGQSGPQDEFSCYQRTMSTLPWRQIETLGNHDLTPPLLEDFTARHGSVYFATDVSGVRLLSLHIRYRPESEAATTEWIDEQQLSWLRHELMAVDAGKTLVILAHSPLTRIPEIHPLLQGAGMRQRILVITGHTHRPECYRLGSAWCLNLGHCRDHPADVPFGRSFYVLRITDDELIAVPWRWDQNDWECGVGWDDPDEAVRNVSLFDDRTR